MNVRLYSDSEKNLFMFLPEEIPDEQIVSIGERIKPGLEVLEHSGSRKPLGSVDYKCIHATYPVYKTFTDLNYLFMSEIDDLISAL